MQNLIPELNMMGECKDKYIYIKEEREEEGLIQ
jgi:hypothetical protein